MMDVGSKTASDGRLLRDGSEGGSYADDPPSITFELCSNNVTILTDSDDQTSTGIHFLTHDPDTNCLLIAKEEPDDDDTVLDTVRGRHDLLEYLIREDGSVVCKWCGEVLPTRTHWYRHKYKFHVPSSNGPATLFKCERCNVFFKSRKGYLGHLATRHGDDDDDERTLDLEVKVEEGGRGAGGRRRVEVVPRGEDYEQQREREEKLVSDIIDRVRRECEAQGATVTRRGYSRRSTVMNS